MLQFKERSNAAEIMDDLSISGEVIDKTLKELEIINDWLGGNGVIQSGLEKVHKKRPLEGKITIADVGCGGGDLLKLISLWAGKRGLDVSLTGIDANPDIIRYAEENTSAFPEIHYMCKDIFSPEFSNETFDLITSTLFCHHFTDEQLIAMLQQFGKQARKAIVINDLHRHWFAYYSIKWITGVFSKSYMVKHDACVSVQRAFRRQELQRIIEAAGFSDYSIQWKWAFRFEIVIFV
ncbi:MAG: methyltransferase domain-containing protein [Cytophagaceae bacterium]